MSDQLNGPKMQPSDLSTRALSEKEPDVSLARVVPGFELIQDELEAAKLLEPLLDALKGVESSELITSSGAQVVSEVSGPILGGAGPLAGLAPLVASGAAAVAGVGLAAEGAISAAEGRPTLIDKFSAATGFPLNDLAELPKYISEKMSPIKCAFEEGVEPRAVNGQAPLPLAPQTGELVSTTVSGSEEVLPGGADATPAKSPTHQPISPSTREWVSPTEASGEAEVLAAPHVGGEKPDRAIEPVREEGTDYGIVPSPTTEWVLPNQRYPHIDLGESALPPLERLDSIGDSGKEPDISPSIIEWVSPSEGSLHVRLPTSLPDVSETSDETRRAIPKPENPEPVSPVIREDLWRTGQHSIERVQRSGSAAESDVETAVVKHEPDGSEAKGGSPGVISQELESSSQTAQPGTENPSRQAPEPGSEPEAYSEQEYDAAKSSSLLDHPFSYHRSIADLWDDAVEAARNEPVLGGTNEQARNAYDGALARFVTRLVQDTDTAREARQIFVDNGFRFLTDDDGNLKRALPVLDLPEVEQGIAANRSDIIRISGQHLTPISRDTSEALNPDKLYWIDLAPGNLYQLLLEFSRNLSGRTGR